MGELNRLTRLEEHPVRRRDAFLAEIAEKKARSARAKSKAITGFTATLVSGGGSVFCYRFGYALFQSLGTTVLIMASLVALRFAIKYTVTWCDPTAVDLS